MGEHASSAVMGSVTPLRELDARAVPEPLDLGKVIGLSGPNLIESGVEA